MHPNIWLIIGIAIVVVVIAIVIGVVSRRKK